MSGGQTQTYKVHLSRSPETGLRLNEGEAPPPLPEPLGNIPRISRLMALAIRIDGLIRSGQVRDQAEVARLGHVTRARVTQIMNLLSLAPDIQEQVLFLPRTTKGRDRIGERELRPIAANPDWRAQRRMWQQLGNCP